jgi:hypothetical protein
MKILPLDWHGANGQPPADDRLRALARAIRNLSPDWQNPERFYARRDELSAEARRLAASPPALSSTNRR